MRTKIAAGNWKMNGTRSAMTEIMAIATEQFENVEAIICPPFTMLSEAMAATQGTALMIGAQNAHQSASGAYTGEISAEMLLDLGVKHVILGHSERREYFGETSELVAQKAAHAHSSGLTAIICVGETLEERDAGKAVAVVSDQIVNSLPEGTNAANTVIAYEPVWAIGTGRVPSNDDIVEIHSAIRAIVPDTENMRILYGGSVKPENALEIFSLKDVDGGLVGGASLKASDFLPIIQAAAKASM